MEIEEFMKFIDLKDEIEKVLEGLMMIEDLKPEEVRIICDGFGRNEIRLTVGKLYKHINLNFMTDFPAYEKHICWMLSLMMLQKFNIKTNSDVFYEEEIKKEEAKYDL